MTVAEKVVDIQRLLADIRVEYGAEISEYVSELNYLQRVCNEQTMEIQRVNRLLERKEEEIRILEGV